MKPTMVQLPPVMIERLDARADADGMSRSALIRLAVAHLLDEGQDDRIAASYQAGYGEVPAGTPDDWGDVAAFHAELRRARAEPPAAPTR